MMKKELTKEELKVLKILLDAGKPLQGREVVEYFLTQYNVARTKSTETKVYTYLARLVSKGYAAGQKIGLKGTIYVSLICKNEILQEESAKFLNAIFDGSLTDFVCCFADNNLSTEKIEELKREIFDL